MKDIQSKLPHVGTTIFTVMTQRAVETGSINLAQGFPDFAMPSRLKELVTEHVALDHNQYAPMTGVEALREEIAKKIFRSYARQVNPQTDVTITLGATEGIFSSIQALVHPGDEVIVFDPSYDSYAPAILLAGAKPVHIPMVPNEFSIDWPRVRESITPRTRMIVLNSPHNPATTVITGEDVNELSNLTRDSKIVIVSDEVYEHMVFDGRKHISLCAHSELAERTVCVFSFGKSMHATGWRVGYTVAPSELTREIRRVHQFNTFSITAPLQFAIADFLRESPKHNDDLAGFYQAKRDYFLQRLDGSRFKWKPSAGTYFQLLDYSEISAEDDVQFAETLIASARVASIPLSPFYASPTRLPYLRFCFAKSESTLDQAAERLRKMR